MPDPSDALGGPAISTDLVEYIVVVAPDSASLASVVPALLELVERSAIRVLDSVLVVAGANGSADAMEVSADANLVGLRDLVGTIGGLLSRHDLEIVSAALEPGTAAIVLVAEDRWAEPLAAAARRAGGQVLAGERIARGRVEAALDRVIRQRSQR